MNIQIQCCGLILVLLIMFFNLRQKKIGLYTEKAYFSMVLVTFFSIVLDVLSVLTIMEKDYLSEMIVDFTCKIYLISLLAVAVESFLYICIDASTEKKRFRIRKRIFPLIAVISAVITAFLPMEYFSTQTGMVYYTGAASVFTYAMLLFFVINTFIIAFKAKGIVNHRRRNAVILWTLMWIFAIFVQSFYRGIYFISFACALGELVLYFKLENPETYLDKPTGQFNSNAFILYSRQLYKKHVDFSVLSISYDSWINRNIAQNAMSEAKIEVIEYLKKLHGSVLFKKAEDELLIIFTDMENAGENSRMIIERFKRGWGKNGAIYLNPNIVFIPQAKVVSSPEEIMYVLRYTSTHYAESGQTYFKVIDENIVTEMRKEKETIRLITDAINDDRIRVFYQPIYSTSDKKFTSAEALVRIIRKNGSVVPPSVFIEAAEKNGLIIKLGEMVFEKVCEFLERTAPEELGFDYIEVNLSVVQCAYENLAKDFIKIMDAHHIEPSWINLEITESASIDAKNILLKNMKELMDYGVRFSLDDFGTGQSNLNYIVDMPVNIVKFDRNMINSYFNNGKAKYVMDAAMHMIHGMDLKIVSEGIESKHQFETMHELGISYIQGYYFSKPLPEDEFVKFIRNASDIKEVC